jgi:hypothetical protein
MPYQIICDKCGMIGKKSYRGNAEKILNRHLSKLKNRGHNVRLVFFNWFTESLGKA